MSFGRPMLTFMARAFKFTAKSASKLDTAPVIVVAELGSKG